MGNLLEIKKYLILSYLTLLVSILSYLIIYYLILSILSYLIQESIQKSSLNFQSTPRIRREDLPCSDSTVSHHRIHDGCDGQCS